MNKDSTVHLYKQIETIDQPVYVTCSFACSNCEICCIRKLAHQIKNYESHIYETSNNTKCFASCMSCISVVYVMYVFHMFGPTNPKAGAGPSGPTGPTNVKYITEVTKFEHVWPLWFSDYGWRTWLSDSLCHNKKNVESHTVSSLYVSYIYIIIFIEEIFLDSTFKDCSIYQGCGQGAQFPKEER